MNDYYTEQLVKKKTTSASIFAKAGLIIATAASVSLIFFIPFAIIVPIIMVLVDVALFRRMDLEFEYLYVNGDLDIDKIMAKQKRKRVFETNVKNIEVLAPTGSIELQQYQHTKTYDFSSRAEGRKLYELVTVEKGETVKIVFEPNQVILDGMKMLAPRKVFI